MYQTLNYRMNIQGLNCGNCLAQTRTEPPGAWFSWTRYSTNAPKTEPLLTLIFSLPQVSFSSTSPTPLSTVLAGLMMMAQYHSAVSAVEFECVIPVITPLAFLLTFMILMWASAFWWKSALLIADAISWSILLQGSTLSSLLSLRRLSAMLDPAIGAGPGPGPGPTGAL
jgi:hypothetical protein